LVPMKGARGGGDDIRLVAVAAPPPTSLKGFSAGPVSSGLA